MAWKRSTRSVGILFDMTPASDIIFTLLLFFILTQQALPLMQVELPSVGEHRRQDDGVPVPIEVTASGRVVWDGTPLPAEDWLSAVASRARQLPASAPVVLEIDRKAPAGIALELLDRLQTAGINRLAVAGHDRKTAGQEAAR